MSDPKPNPLGFLDHPAFYIGGSLLAMVGNAFGYFDFYMMLFVIAVAVYGMVTWYRKRSAN